MKKEKKYNNKLGITSMILFIVGLLVICLGFLRAYQDGSEYSGLWLVFAFILGLIPFLISGILALINIKDFYSKNEIKKCNKFFLIIDWIIICLIILPFICIKIYNLFAQLFL